MSVDPPPPLPSPRPAVSAVTGAIQQAARATGASFDYLLATAKVESDLDPTLSMRSSSATGLFQFIEQTWLEVLKQAGKTMGFGRYADAITETKSGRYEVADPAMRAEIMTLRKDPAANAAMGGVFTQQNAAILTERLGRKPTDGELYIAHFFGPYSAAKVITMAGSNPTANAAQLFPAAAHANRPIFYDKQGSPRSVAGVYQELVRRYQVARASPAPATTTAPASTASRAPFTIPKPQILPEVAEGGAAALTTVASADATLGVSGAAQPTAAAGGVSPVRQARRPDDAGPMFLSLFQTEERRGAVSPAVSELWGSSTARLRGSAIEGPSAAAFAQSADDKGGTGSPLDLFQDMPPNVRGLFDAGK